MKYRNTKTGTVICTHCKVTGDNWVPIPAHDQKEPPAETQERSDPGEKSATDPQTDEPAAAAKSTKSAPKRTGKKGA